jgi:hypothetical protein
MAARAGTASLTLVRGGLTAFTRNGSLASLGGQKWPAFRRNGRPRGKGLAHAREGPRSRCSRRHSSCSRVGRAQRAIRSGERVRAARPGEQSKPATPRERSERAVPRRSRAVRNGRPRGNGLAHAREGRAHCVHPERISRVARRRQLPLGLMSPWKRLTATAVRAPRSRRASSHPFRRAATSRHEPPFPRERRERGRSA